MHHELVNTPIVGVKQSLCAHRCLLYEDSSTVYPGHVASGSMSKGYQATAAAFVKYTDLFRGHNSLARGLWHSPAGKGCK